MRKFLRALFRRPRKSPPAAMAHIPGWTPLGRKAVAVRIAEVSGMQISRKGWDALTGKWG